MNYAKGKGRSGGGGGGLPSLFASTIQDTDKIGKQRFHSPQKYVQKDIEMQTVIGPDLKENIRQQNPERYDALKSPGRHAVVGRNGKRTVNREKRGVDIFALMDSALETGPTEEAKQKARDEAAEKKAIEEVPLPEKIPKARPRPASPPSVPALFASAAGSTATGKEPAWKTRMNSVEKPAEKSAEVARNNSTKSGPTEPAKRKTAPAWKIRMNNSQQSFASYDNDDDDDVDESEPVPTAKGIINQTIEDDEASVDISDLESDNDEIEESKKKKEVERPKNPPRKEAVTSSSQQSTREPAWKARMRNNNQSLANDSDQKTESSASVSVSISSVDTADDEKRKDTSRKETQNRSSPKKNEPAWKARMRHAKLSLGNDNDQRTQSSVSISDLDSTDDDIELRKDDGPGAHTRARQPVVATNKEPAWKTRMRKIQPNLASDSDQRTQSSVSVSDFDTTDVDAEPPKDVRREEPPPFSSPKREERVLKPQRKNSQKRLVDSTKDVPSVESNLSPRGVTSVPPSKATTEAILSPTIDKPKPQTPQQSPGKFFSPKKKSSQKSSSSKKETKLKTSSPKVENNKISSSPRKETKEVSSSMTLRQSEDDVTTSKVPPPIASPVPSKSSSETIVSPLRPSGGGRDQTERSPPIGGESTAPRRSSLTFGSPLRASNHSRRTSNHSLMASNQSLMASDHSLMASSHSLMASNHSLNASNHPDQNERSPAQGREPTASRRSSSSVSTHSRDGDDDDDYPSAFKFTATPKRPTYSASSDSDTDSDDDDDDIRGAFSMGGSDGADTSGLPSAGFEFKIDYDTETTQFLFLLDSTYQSSKSIEWYEEQIKEAEKRLAASLANHKLQKAELTKIVDRKKESLTDIFDGKMEARLRIGAKLDRTYQKEYEDEQKIVESLRKENKRVRGEVNKLPRQIFETQQSILSVEAANKEIEEHLESLGKFAKKLERDHERLQSSSLKCRDEYFPRYRNELRQRETHIDCETTIKNLYRNCILKISRRIRKSELQETTNEIILETEADVNPKFNPAVLFDSDSSSSDSSSDDDSSSSSD